MRQMGVIQATQPVSLSFAQRVANRYAGMKSVTSGLSPLVSTKRFMLFLNRWMELVYIMPYVTLRREILKSLIKTRTNLTTQPIQQIWNIMVYLKGNTISAQYGKNLAFLEKMVSAEAGNIYLSSQKTEPKFNDTTILNLSHPFYFSGGTRLTTPTSKAVTSNAEVAERTEHRAGQATINPLAEPSTTEPSRDAGFLQLTLSHAYPLVSHQPIALSYNKPMIVTQPGYSAKQETINRASSEPVSSALEESERKSGITDSTIPSGIQGSIDETFNSHPLSYTSLEGDKQGREVVLAGELRSFAEGALPQDRDVFNRSQTDFQSLGQRKSIYRTFPTFETASPGVFAQSTTNKKEEKVREATPSAKPTQPQNLDLDRVADQVYRLIERKIRIERERRGL